LDKHKNFNLQHDDNLKLEATVVESWIINDSNNDKANSLGFDLPVGTWMVSVAPKDTNLLTEEFLSTFKGFSIEGNFYQEEVKLNNNNIMSKIENILEKLSSFLGLNSVEVPAILPPPEAPPAEVKQETLILADGTVLEIDDSTGMVYFVNEDGTLGASPEDGEYILANGDLLTIVAGVGAITTAMQQIEDLKKQLADSKGVNEMVSKELEQSKQLLKDAHVELSKQIVIENPAKFLQTTEIAQTQQENPYIDKLKKLRKLK
jgi:hypothetical protein